MANKESAIIEENVPFILPSDNEELKLFIYKYKIDMTEQVVSSVEYALKNKLPFVELFQFKNTAFVVTISQKEFDTNIDNIYNYYLTNEIYELCPRVIKLQKLLKRSTNEK